MSKLTEFYSHRDSLAQASSSAQLDTPQWEAIEEKLIREDVLPRLMARIAPVIGEVRSALSLTINYDPNGALSLSFTRNCLQMTIGAVPPSVEPNDETQKVEDDEESVAPDAKPVKKTASTDHTSAPILLNEDNTIEAEKRDLRITIDGKVYQEKNSIQTFIAALKHIGLDCIPQVGITCSGYNLVDTRQRKDGNRKWQQEEDGKWIYIYFSNPTKVKYLFKIAEYLKKSIQIEAI